MDRSPELTAGTLPGGDDDSDDEFFRLVIMPALETRQKRKHGGSTMGKRTAKDRKRSKWGGRADE
ncbi:hypothetical protein PR002_g3049 [Phytophthora rubi]|uniref:Uncharacterized protein n=1 Tax=Phytophthora rubi TaxID=129364 RepID=A0A6A3NL20_9STRA|nr:hypothetical protein PR002_g3049 [Phytophthora rubi]